jgi:dihydrofolate reductase
MGEIHVHEFMSFDGVIDAPTWTFEYGFDPKMGELLGAVTGRSRGILLGRTTYEAFAQAWPDRTVEDDPGAPFFIYPLTLGAGTRLFTDQDPSRKLSLAASESYENGVIYAGYRPQA